MKASLFGFGRFGKLFYEHFKKDFNFSIYDKNEDEIRRNLKKKDFHPFPLKESEIIFLSVPISSVKLVAKEIKSKVNPSTLIVEMCSVKEEPLNMLQKFFPKNQIVGLHPLFGPDSVENSLEGHQAILVSKNYNSKAFKYLLKVLKDKKIKLHKMSAAQHDELMAYTLCLTQFIGRALSLIRLPDKKIGTKGYFDLVDIIQRTRKDTLQLFVEMNKYNRFSKLMRQKVIDRIIQVDSILDFVKKDFYVQLNTESKKGDYSLDRFYNFDE